MNNSAHSSLATITTGPIYHSEKHYIDVPYDAAVSAPGAALLEGSPSTCTLHVPVRRINLTNGEHCDVYDTSVNVGSKLHQTLQRIETATQPWPGSSAT